MIELYQAPKRQPVRNLTEKRLGEVKWGHHVDLARRRDDTLQERHRPGNRTLAEEAHQADHCKAAVVDLSLQLLGLPLVALVLVEAERVVQVQRSRVGQKWVAVRVFESPDTRLSFLTWPLIFGQDSKWNQNYKKKENTKIRKYENTRN